MLYDSYSMASSFDPPTQNTITVCSRWPKDCLCRISGGNFRSAVRDTAENGMYYVMGKSGWSASVLPDFNNLAFLLNILCAALALYSSSKIYKNNLALYESRIFSTDDHYHIRFRS